MEIADFFINNDKDLPELRAEIMKILTVINDHQCVPSDDGD
ncbi:hypothetical protein ACFLRB_05500 [Acidobacteriota bacterium]